MSLLRWRQGEGKSRPLTDPLDLLDFDGLLSDEERQIRATVARFVTEHVRPFVAD